MPANPTITHLVAVAAVVVVLGIGVIAGRRLMSRPEVDPAPAPIEQPKLPGMPLPDLTGLPALPDAASVAEEQAEVSRLLGERRAPFLGAGLDAVAFGWLQAVLEQDRAKPPIPQRLSAQDLAESQAAPGIPAVITGRLADFAPGRDGWAWLSVALGENRYALVLAQVGKDDVVIGNEAQIAGRFLGALDAPSQDSGSQVLPALAARSVAMLTGGTAPPLDVISVGDAAEFHAGRFAPPPDLYRDIDDERPYLETRPYYYTLGQVKLDASTPGRFDDLPSANERANDIHQKPATYRGQLFRITGQVFQAWEDPHIAQDRPFEVGRVGRILMWKSDWGPYSETVNGVQKTSNKAVRRLFELAVIGDQPLPAVGTTVTAVGRFLKYRCIPVVVDAERDQRNNVVRTSDKIYSMFFVSPAYEAASAAPQSQIQWQDVAIALVTLVVAIAVVLVIGRSGSRPSRRRVRP
jgi:hypothetical protein